VFVTAVLPPDRTPLACGPQPMLDAVRRLRPDAQIACEAPMACGYGALLRLRRRGRREAATAVRRGAGAVLLNASGCLDATTRRTSRARSTPS
jgi:ferredoxin-NADP reductase